MRLHGSRSFRPLYRRLAVLAVAAGFAGCSTPANSEKPPGTRWSTIDLKKIYPVKREHEPELEAERERAVLSERRKELAPRALAAGAELVWDIAGGEPGGPSPVVFAEPRLALPRSGRVTVRTVDFMQLRDTHPKLLALHAQGRIAEAERRETRERLRAEGEALRAELAWLTFVRDTAGAARASERLEAHERAGQAFAREQRRLLLSLEGLGQAVEFYAALEREIVAEVATAARARGVTVVLDAGQRSRSGDPCLVWVAAPLRPADGGGLRAGPAPEAAVRTIDLASLYERHPRTRELSAQLRADDADLQRQVERRRQALADEYAKLPASVDRDTLEQRLEGRARRENEIETFHRDAAHALTVRRAEQRRAAVGEIAKIAGELAERAGATLVVDTAGAGFRGLPLIAYAAPQLDLTEAVARELGIAPR